MYPQKHAQSSVHLLECRLGLLKVVPHEALAEFPVILLVHLEQLTKHVCVDHVVWEGRWVPCSNLGHVSTLHAHPAASRRRTYLCCAHDRNMGDGATKVDDRARCLPRGHVAHLHAPRTRQARLDPRCETPA